MGMGRMTVNTSVNTTTRVLGVRLTADERALVEQAAKRMKVSAAAWLRQRAVIDAQTLLHGGRSATAADEPLPYTDPAERVALKPFTPPLPLGTPRPIVPFTKAMQAGKKQ